MHLKHGNLNSEYSHHGSECVKRMKIKLITDLRKWDECSC